jgi:lipoprotein-anchoring transpeptidase ErfK/SrfK
MIRNSILAATVAALALVSPVGPSLAATNVKDKPAAASSKKPVVAKKRVADPKKVAVVAKPRKVSKRDCGSFLACLFSRRDGSRISRSAYGKYQNQGLSTRMTRKTVSWDESKYPVGSLVVRTPERALYLITGEGEALRYKVGVGREGFQWSGQARISAKREWPSWTPPQEMIEREAEKGIEIPAFMEGGPGNPLGARALYIGGTIFRVHGTNNEASIGGAVSSGCIRMMNADVIDLYNRVKVGSRIYVYQ